MKKGFLLIVLGLLSNLITAQIHEVGISAGASNFIGDIGRTNYLFPNAFGGGLVYKYNLNPRIALTGNYTYIGIKGDDIDSNNSFRLKRQTSFSNTIHELSVGTEVNFFHFNVNNPEMAYTPYIFARLAGFYYQEPTSFNRDDLKTSSVLSYTVPMGIGFKGRLTENIAFSIESGVRLTFIDDLDYTTNKIKELDFGGQGNDHYIFSGISITYTFGRPPCFADLED